MKMPCYANSATADSMATIITKVNGSMSTTAVTTGYSKADLTEVAVAQLGSVERLNGQRHF